MFVKYGDEIKRRHKTIDKFGQLPICVTQTWWMFLIKQRLPHGALLIRLSGKQLRIQYRTRYSSPDYLVSVLRVI